MSEICDLTELPKESCAHCRGYFWDPDTQEYVKEKEPLFGGLLKEKDND